MIVNLTVLENLESELTSYLTECLESNQCHEAERIEKALGYVANLISEFHVVIDEDSLGKLQQELRRLDRWPELQSLTKLPNA